MSSFICFQKQQDIKICLDHKPAGWQEKKQCGCLWKYSPRIVINPHPHIQRRANVSADGETERESQGWTHTLRLWGKFKDYLGSMNRLWLEVYDAVVQLNERVWRVFLPALHPALTPHVTADSWNKPSVCEMDELACFIRYPQEGHLVLKRHMDESAESACFNTKWCFRTKHLKIKKQPEG